MEKSKALEKFKDSKIPKKGGGIATEKLTVYEAPNTNSKIMGYVEKGELTEWISKSICQGYEWARCGAKNLFGYLIAINEDGKYNFNKIEPIKKEEPISKNPTFPKEQMDMGIQAKNQIIHDIELGTFRLELKNDYNKNLDKPEETNQEDIPIIYGLDDLEKDQIDKNLNDTINDQNIIQKINKETHKLAQELSKQMNQKNINNQSFNCAINPISKIQQNTDIFSSSSFSPSSSSTSSSSTTYIPDNFFSLCNYSAEFLCLTSSEIGSSIYIKYVWKNYKVKQIKYKKG